MAAQTWIAYTDGACRGNPGPSACGVRIIAPDGGEHDFRFFLGDKTNNQAEYEALLLALGELQKLGAREVLVRADSELMIRQMLGQYKVKNANMIPLFQKAKILAASFEKIQFEHVRREFNKEADRLANEALDEAT